MKLSKNHSMLALFVAGSIALSSGCMTLTPFANKSIPTDSGKASSGEYQVVLVPSMGKSTTYSGRVTDGLTVQGTLEQSGALKKFRNMDVELYRVVPESGKTLKMAFDFQPSKRILKFEQDYQILPGDRIVVKAQANALEKLFTRPE